MQTPIGYRELVPGVTVIVPHGGAERLALLRTSLPRLREVRGVARIVLVELDDVPRAVELGRGFADFHVFAPGNGPFHKTRAMNIGLGFVRTSHFLWLDGDMLLPEDLVTDALQECIARGLDCLVPWTEVHYLSAADSQKVARGDCAPGACVAVNRFESSIMVPGSAVLVRTDFVHRHGGMAEQFRGWGCEDTAWYLKARMLGSIGAPEIGEPERGTRILHHLYHPTSGGYSDFKDLFQRPEYRRNFAILGLMKSYQTPEAFSRRHISRRRGRAPNVSPAHPVPRQSVRHCWSFMATRSACARLVRSPTRRFCRRPPPMPGMRHWRRSAAWKW